RGVGHHAVPLEIADLRPGRPVPGELHRLLNRRMARRWAADDRGDRFFARTARAESVGLGVLALRVTDGHAGPGLWTNHERDRVLAVPRRSVGEGSWGKRQGDRERRSAQTDETPQTFWGHRFLLSARNGFGSRMRRDNLGCIPHPYVIADLAGIQALGGRQGCGPRPPLRRVTVGQK